jgi:hypothetical protein
MFIRSKPYTLKVRFNEHVNHDETGSSTWQNSMNRRHPVTERFRGGRYNIVSSHDYKFCSSGHLRNIREIYSQEDIPVMFYAPSINIELTESLVLCTVNTIFKGTSTELNGGRCISWRSSICVFSAM